MMMKKAIKKTGKTVGRAAGKVKSGMKGSLRPFPTKFEQAKYNRAIESHFNIKLK